MSYISIIEPLDHAVVRARAVGSSAPARPVSGIAGKVGWVLAALVEGVVFFTVLGGLSLAFCGLVAGV